jgi:Ca-activated chloride channel family protein
MEFVTVSGPFSFPSAWLLLALLVVPVLLVFALVVDRRRSRYPVAFTNLELLAGLAEPRRRLWRRLPLMLLLLALACASTALARPTATLTSSERRATIVFLVDVSGSMRATDVEPTRLDAAVNAIREALARVPSAFEVGLVTFSSRPDVLVAPTRDRRVLNEALDYLVPSGGTALGDALAAAVKLTVASLAKEGVHRAHGRYLPAAIVLESDGAQTEGGLRPARAAQIAKAAGVRVDAVALGSPGGQISFPFLTHTHAVPVPPDPATVRMISKLTGGEAYTAETATRAVDVYKTLGSSIGRTRTRREIGSWFSAAAAALLLSALGAGRLVEGRLP